MKTRIVGASYALASTVALLSVTACSVPTSTDVAGSEAPQPLAVHPPARAAHPHAIGDRMRGRANGAHRTWDAAEKPGADPPIPAKYQAFAAAVLADMEAFGAPGAAVALLENGKVTFSHGFGVKGPHSKEPVDARTLFRFGSMNKALTAATFLHLVDEGKAEVEAPVAQAVPGVALTGAGAALVTMGDLLTQQSGLFDFTNYGANPVLTDVACPTSDEALHTFVTGSLFSQSELFMAPPRALWAYSNTNYVLAGAAIEQASGMFYADAMKSILFDPLGMTRTTFDPAQVVSDGDYAHGLSTHADGSPWDVAPASYDCGWYRPAGYGFTSVLDYAQFVEFLDAGNPAVLSDARRAEMQAPIVDTYDYGTTSFYGGGLEVGTAYPAIPSGFYDSKVVWHQGGIPGFSSEFFYFPETGFAYIAFASTDGAYFGSSLELALQSFSGLSISPTTPPSLDPDAGPFAEYPGTFVDESGLFGQFVVTDQQGTIGVDFPVLDAAGITYAPTLTSYAEYGLYSDVTAVPPSQSTVLAAILAASGQISVNYIPGRHGELGWIQLQGALAARRVSGP